MTTTSYSDVQHKEQQESATSANLHYGFFQTPDAVLTTKGLSWRARCVYERLLCYARKKETCYPGHARLAADLGKSVDTIQRGLRELRDYGLVTWKRRGLTKTNVYTIVKLTEVPAFNTDAVAPMPQKCSDKNPQECGLLKPQKCGTNHTQSKNTQVETDEDSSNSLGGMAEVSQTCSHVEHGAIRKTEEKTGEGTSSTPLSNREADTPLHTDPSPPTRAASSKPETPPSGARPRRLLSLSKTDEVTGKKERAAKPEPPRLPAPPLTQEDMDQRIRERLARERGRAELQNPLPGIIRDVDWHKLEQDAPTQTNTGTRSKPMPVFPKLQQALEQISQELGDFVHVTSNITHADNIRRESGLELDTFLERIYDARYATKYAVATGKITKRDASGKLLKMPYFFSCLRQKLGLPKRSCVV